jgi:hypothetical protein
MTGLRKLARLRAWWLRVTGTWFGAVLFVLLGVGAVYAVCCAVKGVR